MLQLSKLVIRVLYSFFLFPMGSQASILIFKYLKHSYVKSAHYKYFLFNTRIVHNDRCTAMQGIIGGFQ